MVIGVHIVCSWGQTWKKGSDFFGIPTNQQNLDAGLQILGVVHIFIEINWGYLNIS